jgi:hypothetical protein
LRSCALVLPLWTAAVDPRVLRARCLPCRAGEEGAFDAACHPARVVAADGREHVSVEMAGEPLRLDVISGSVLRGPVRLEAVIPVGPGLGAQVASLGRLGCLLRGCMAEAQPDKRLARLGLALRAVDARAAGASLRSIARVILGAPDWPGDGECVKSASRRLVALAEALRRAGPAAILQGRI